MRASLIWAPFATSSLALVAHIYLGRQPRESLAMAVLAFITFIGAVVLSDPGFRVRQ